MKTVPACYPLSFLHILQFLQLQLTGCKFIEWPLASYTICSGNVSYLFSHLLGEGRRIVFNEEKMESLKRNVLFPFLSLPFFPNDLALRYEMGQSEVVTWRQRVSCSVSEPQRGRAGPESRRVRGIHIRGDSCVSESEHGD